MSPSEQRLCSEAAPRAAQHAKKFVLFPAGHCGALELGVRCFSANIPLLKSGNFYRGVIPSVPTILALTGSPLYPKAAILCTYLFYLLALFTPYPFPIEVLLPAVLRLELCYSLCSTASYCKSIQQLHKPYNWTVNSNRTLQRNRKHYAVSWAWSGS